MSGPRPPRWVSGLWNALAHALPGPIRDDAAGEMAATFEARWCAARARSRGAAARLLAQELWDLVGTGLRMHWARRRRLVDRRDGGEEGTMAALVQDLGLAWRTLSRRPAYMVITSVTLALGIGADTAIFGVVDAVVLRPLPFPDAGELVMVWHTLPSYETRRGPFSWRNYVAVRDRAGSLSGAAAFAGSQATLLDRGAARRIQGRAVSGNTFELLGVPALHGRVILPADDDPGAPPVVVLSHALWTDAWGGDPRAVGREFRTEGASATIVGVMPPGFPGLAPSDQFWRPLALGPEARLSDTNFLQVVARLARGADLEGATTEVSEIVRDQGRLHPEDARRDAFLETRHAFVTGDARAQLWIMLGAVSLVLLAACVNVAGLALTRTSGRARELALRTALGADRRRLARLLLTESAWVTAVGGALGAALAVALTRAFLAWGPADLPRRAEVGIDLRAMLFLLAVTGVCALVWGLLPALRISDRPPSAELREGSGAGSPGVGRSRARQTLVAVQIALAALLLVGGGLLTRSLARLESVELGFDPRGVVAATFPLQRESGPEKTDLLDWVVEGALRVPGVEAVAASWSVPFGGSWGSTRVAPEGSEIPFDDRPEASMVPIRGDFFGVMGIRVVEGSGFARPIGAAEPPVAVVSRAFARRLWPEGGAVGSRFQRGDGDAPLTTVVGVVDDVRGRSLEREPEPIMYQPLEQAAWIPDVTVVLRTGAADPLSVVEPLRRVVAGVDPAIALDPVVSMEAAVHRDAADSRFRARLVGAFALVVGMLALVGVYGVMSLVVSGRTRELGVRIALGARRRRVLGEVLGQGVVLGGLGIAVGLVVAVASSGVLASLLYEIDPHEPLTYAAVALALLACTLLAVLVPATRAASVDPVRALREH